MPKASVRLAALEIQLDHLMNPGLDMEGRANSVDLLRP